MSNYVKASDFAVKDSLTTGDPLKIIKGTELNTEFNLIQTAVGTKADLASPNFLGNPTAVTQPTGNSSNRLATTAFVTQGINANQANASITGGTITGVAITGGTISGLATDLAPADGGTGRSSLTANNLILGNGTSAVNFVAPSTSGNVLTSNGTTWQSSPLDFTGSFTANGYQKLPSGLIMQWGNGGALTENQTQTISYPIGFPSAVAVVMTTITGNTSASGDNGSVDIVSRNSTSFTAKSTSQPNISGFSWFAIGF